LLKVACSGPGVSRTRNLSVTSPILYQLDHCSHHVSKGKGLDTCYSAAYMSQTRDQTSSALQSRKWQLIGMSQWCRSALCGHPLLGLRKISDEFARQDHRSRSRSFFGGFKVTTARLRAALSRVVRILSDGFIF